MRLIDAETLPIEPCVPNTFISRDYAFGYNDMLRNVLKAPPIDAVPVVRCKDCKWFIWDDDVDYVCAQIGKYMGFDDFCSYGERRSE